MNNCTLTLLSQGEPGLPGEAGMAGVPGPKGQIQNYHMNAVKKHCYEAVLNSFPDFCRVTEASGEKVGHRESSASL